MPIEDFNHYNQLLDYYANLLTKVQQGIMTDYYRLNLSLSEISENRGISRAAVSDALNTGKNKLTEYEHKLGLLAKKEQFDEIYAKMMQVASPEIKELLEALKEVI